MKTTGMASERSSDVKFEIGHILFIDIVGYSRLLIHEQTERLETLKQVVRGTQQFQTAEREGKLLRLPSGDGGALVFRNSLEAPLRCAVEISQALKNHPELRVRMGIHSGPVNEIVDLNEQANIAGAGINIAQRVMDCGDAGHILVSKHVAEDLTPFQQWNSALHDLGECEVKHGQKLGLVNFYTNEIGNPNPPVKCDRGKIKAVSPRLLVAAGIGVALVAIAAFWLLPRESSTTAVRDAPVRKVENKSVAVLPFDNLSSEQENAYFADGVQDEILTALSRVADLKVISRTSVMQYKSGVARNLPEIGRQLGVAHLLEGSVQRVANRVRINAQLIDARTDSHSWAQTYDRELADVFAIQSEIAEAIAAQLQARILAQEKQAIEQEPTKNLAAYNFYAHASRLLDSALFADNARKLTGEAIELFEQAIRLDPSFFAARCKLARAHDQLYLLGLDHTPERLALADEAVEAAVRLQPDTPEAHLALATHLYSKLDYDGARARVELARRALPNDARALELSAYINRRQGHYAESVREMERALELDPNNISMLHQISISYTVLRQFPEAVAALDRVLSIKPGDVDTQVNREQLMVFWKADTKPLHDSIESFLRKEPGSGARVAATRLFLAQAERDPVNGLNALADFGANTAGPDAFQYPPEWFEGVFCSMKGDGFAAEAAFLRARTVQQQVVDREPEYAPALSVLALIDARLGRKDDAIREGRRAVELLPPSKDAINGASIMSHLAVIYAWVGEKDLAVAELQRILQFPGRTSYGNLRLFPNWDPLRGDPRFEKLVNELAPKEIK